jgi:hypothetical protein
MLIIFLDYLSGIVPRLTMTLNLDDPTFLAQSGQSANIYQT